MNIIATISEMSVEIGVNLSDFTSSMRNVGNQLRNLGHGVNPVELDINTSHFESEISSATHQLTDLNNTSVSPTVVVDTSQATQGIREIGNRLEGVGEKLKDIGEGFSKYLTVPLLGLGGAAGFVAGEMEGTSARIQNSLGVTAEEAKKLTKTAKDIYSRGFGESMEDVRTALIQTKQNIKGLNDEELNTIITQAKVLADTFDAEVNEVTRAGNNIMKGFGLSSQEAFDLMGHGAQNGLNFSNEMFDNLSEYAPLFGKMGFSAQEYFQLLEKGSQAGVYNLDYINDIMKEFQIRVKDGSKATSDAMGQMSESTNKVWKAFLNGEGTVKDVHNTIIAELSGMDNQVKANEIGVGLYGTKWEDLETDAVYSLGGINGALEGVDGTMGKMVKNQEKTFGQRFQGMMRDLKSALLPLGEVLIDLGEEWIPKISSGVSKMSKWFSDLSPSMQKAVVIMGAIGAAIGPVIVVIGTLVSSVGAIATGLGGLATALGVTGGAAGLLSAGLAVLTGPIGLAVAGVAALTLGGIALVNHLKKDAIPEVDRFGDSVSKGTKKALGAYFELSDGASQSLTNIKLNQIALTEETKNALVSQYGQMSDQILAKMDERHTKELEKQQTFFLNSSALTTAEEEKILAAQEMRNQSEIAGQEYKELRIKEILEKAAGEKRTLTESEQIEINGIQQSMNENAVQYLSKNELESKVIMERMKQSASDLSAQQAAEVVANSNKQKEEAVKAANDQYNQTLAEIIRMRDETGDITAEQADKMISEATRQRDETVKRAEDMHGKVVGEAKAQAGEHINTVNWETGEVLSKWEVFKNNVSKKWGNIKSDASKKWGEIKSSIVNAVGEAKDKVSGYIDEIKGFFTNLKLKIPKPSMPSMPSFSLKTSSKTVFGKEISYPSGINVNWNAKGGLFKKPTIFNTAMGLQGFGEAGPEAAIPLTDRVLGTIGNAIARATDDYKSQTANTKPVYLTNIITLDGYEIARNQAPYIDAMQADEFTINTYMKGGK